MRSEYSGSRRFGLPRSKRNLLKLLCSTVVLILIIETSRIILGIWVAKPVVAQWGTIEKGCWVETLFLRDETLIISDYEGSLKQKVENGDRVPRGAAVAYISTGFGFMTSPDDELLRLERTLSVLLSEDEALGLELERVKKEIDRRKDMLNKFPSKAPEVKEDLGSLQQEKEQILRNTKIIRERILKTRITLKREMRGFETILAPEPGFVYFQYDNWEGKLTPDHLSELSEAIFESNIPLKSTGNRVRPGQIITKIISPFNPIIAVKADTSIIGTPSKGDPWWFKTTGGMHRVTLKNIIPLEDGKVILAFEDPGIYLQYMPNRRDKIFAIYKKVNGVTIPHQALIKMEDRTFVKLPKGDDYSLQEVQVLETDGDKVVVEGIDFGTTIMSR